MPTSTNNTWVGTLIFVAVVSYFWSNDSESSSSLLDGSIFNSVHTDTKPLHASHWPFSLMVTAHVLRTVLAAGNSGSWPSQIVKGCFAAYGGLMMKDVLTGNFGLPSLMDNGEALVTLYITIWYFVNHSIPLTDINLWSKLNGVLEKYVTMFPTFMVCLKTKFFRYFSFFFVFVVPRCTRSILTVFFSLCFIFLISLFFFFPLHHLLLIYLYYTGIMFTWI